MYMLSIPKIETTDDGETKEVEDINELGDLFR